MTQSHPLMIENRSLQHQLILLVTIQFLCGIYFVIEIEYVKVPELSTHHNCQERYVLNRGTETLVEPEPFNVATSTEV